MNINTTDRYVIVTTPWCVLTPKLKNKLDRLVDLPVIEEKDADTNHDIMNEFGITTIPTLMLMNSGKEIKRLEGIITMDQLKDFFNK